MLIGLEVIDLYEEKKAQYPDLNEWDATAVREEFGEQLQAPIMAAKICKTTRLPWTDANVFENVALVLNGREALPDIDQDISIKEIAFAVACLKHDFPDDEFEEPVLKYFAAEAGEEGMCILPPELSEGQKYIPPIYLNTEQQQIQNAYLSECKDYVKIMLESMLSEYAEMIQSDTR